MLHSPPPSAARIHLAPVPSQRALAGKRMRPKPAPDDAELLALGRELEASVARQHNINAAIDASVDAASPAFEALLDDGVKEAEVSAQLRRRIVQIRAGTWPGMMLKITLATQFCDVDAAEFADILERDQHVVGEALTTSLCRDLRTWFGRPDPDEELLILGRQFDESWAEERACDAAAERAASEEEREALLREAEEAAERTLALACVIESESATTLAGLAVKARVVSWTHSGESFDDDFFIDREPPTVDHRLTISILRDLAAINGRPLPVEGAATPSTVSKAA